MIVVAINEHLAKYDGACGEYSAIDFDLSDSDIRDHCSGTRLHTIYSVAVLRITSASGAQTEVPLFATEDVETAGIVRKGFDSLVLMALRRLAL